MGILKSGRESRAAKAGEAAKVAWDAGDLAYVHTVEQFVVTGEGGMGKQLSAIMGVGWQLGGTALAFNQKGLNSQQAMFTFVRPS